MTNPVTIIGNITADPELRYSQNGIATANFTVASTEKVFDKSTNDFKDGKTLFLRCTVWREFAENVAGSLTKGTRVIVVGKLATNQFETKEGEKRSSIEMTVDSIGPDLKYATAQVTRVTRTGSRDTTPNDEPWAASPPAVDAGDVSNTPAADSFGGSDETPF